LGTTAVYQPMKKEVIVSLVAFLLMSCGRQSHRIENDLFNCLMDSLSEDEKQKLTPLVKAFEKHLIEKGILESSEGKSYWNLYNKMAETGTYDFSNEFNFSEKISFLDRQNPAENEELIGCHNSILQSEKYTKSKLCEFHQEMESLKKHKITPVIIAKTTIKHLSKEDFELEYNRFNALLFVENFK